MEKPLCRLCRHRHYAGEAHVWPAEPNEASAVSIDTKPRVTTVSSGKFDRVAYQRAYMKVWRKRRAQAVALSS